MYRLRRVLLYVLKNGCLWRDLPGDFPPWSTVYWYFAKWQREGTLVLSQGT